MFRKVLLVALVCFAAAESINIISRKDWGARAPKNPPTTLPVNPPSHVVIHHASSPSCYTKSDCISRVKSFQNYHMDTQKWSDIGYNFVVGEDGNIYEGRGWGKQGAHAVPLNPKSIGICVVGTFNKNAPNAAAQKAVKDLIAYGVSSGKIKSNYKLVGHLQVASTDCPGSSFYSVIKGWPHWTSSP